MMLPLAMEGSWSVLHPVWNNDIIIAIFSMMLSLYGLAISLKLEDKEMQVKQDYNNSLEIVMITISMKIEDYQEIEI